MWQDIRGVICSLFMLNMTSVSWYFVSHKYWVQHIYFFYTIGFHINGNKKL